MWIKLYKSSHEPWWLMFVVIIRTGTLRRFKWHPYPYNLSATGKLSWLTIIMEKIANCHLLPICLSILIVLNHILDAWPSLVDLFLAVKFILYCLFMFLTFMYFTFYGMMAVGLTPTQQLAAVISSSCYSLWNLLSGFLIPKAVSSQ